MTTTSAPSIDWDYEMDLDSASPEPTPTAPPVVQSPKEPKEPSKSTKTRKSVKSNVSGSFLYADIETIPDYSRKHLFGLPPIPEPKRVLLESELLLPEEFCSQTLSEMSTWFSANNPCDTWLDALERSERENAKKGPRKGLLDLISACRNDRNSHLDMAAAQAKKMAVTPEMCRIVAIGLAVDDSHPQPLIDGVDGVTERDLLETFWNLAARTEQIVGFNCLNFDIPAIFVRSILLGIPATKMIDCSKYSKQVIDLYVRRFGNGYGNEPADAKTSKGMKSLARQLGLEVPAGDMDGSQVERVYRENPQLIGDYVTSDIHVTRKIHMLYSSYFC